VKELRGAGRWDEAVALAEDPLVRADLLNEQALFTGTADARRRADEELDRAEALLWLGRGRLLHTRFLAENGDEDPGEQPAFERALELARRLQDRAIEAQALLWVGVVHQVLRGDQPTSLQYFERSYQLARELGDVITMSYAVRHLAIADQEAGRLELAWARLEESAELRRSAGFRPGLAAALVNLGEIAAEQGRPGKARELLAEARVHAHEVGAEPFLRRIESALAALS
jgi:tetratricopeptide (TPR) repeat protein